MPAQPQGWIDDPAAVEAVVATLPRPVFGLAAHDIRDSGEGKVALLHTYVEQVFGNFPIHAQTIGDCVSHGWGLGCDVLACVEVVLKAEAEQVTHETATEPLYAASRVEIGRGQLGNGDGSIGAWMAKAVRQYGTLLRKKYDPYDFTTYSGRKAKEWGRPRAGVPDELEPRMREHTVNQVSLVTSYEEARDAICNGFPVPVCSNQGFKSKRDSKGFARAQGSWKHCMLFMGADDADGRPGLLCMNSWGPNWISGPKRHGQPEGSFWVDADTCDRMLRQNDSFAMSQFAGYPSQELPDPFPWIHD